MAAISDMMSFENVADDDAINRRNMMANDTTNMISGMMFQNVAGDDASYRNNTGGGFMPGIDGEGLSPDRYAQTYSETDDTRYWEGREGLGSISKPPNDITLDRNNTVIPGDRLHTNGINQDEFKDRDKLRGFPKPKGLSGGRMYQREI